MHMGVLFMPGMAGHDGGRYDVCGAVFFSERRAWTGCGALGRWSALLPVFEGHPVGRIPALRGNIVLGTCRARLYLRFADGIAVFARA